jgi:hypothetical protein
MQTDKHSQIFYRYRNIDDDTVLYSASRFLLEISGGDKQIIKECRSKTVSHISINDCDEVVWAEHGRFPWIWVDNQRCLQTKHSQGLIHFTLFKDLILSYGMASGNSFTINLHNYRTQQLLKERTTDKKVVTFLIINPHEFVSLA